MSVEQQMAGIKYRIDDGTAEVEIQSFAKPNVTSQTVPSKRMISFCDSYL